jgi:hypothetical protein
MSQENMELAKRFYPGSVDIVPMAAAPDAWVGFFEPLVHPDFETVGEGLAMSSGGVETAQESSRRSAYGFEGFISVWSDFLSAWDSWVVTPANLIDVDDERVLVLLDIRARSKTHGVEMPIEAANLLTFRDGKLTRLELFNTQPEAPAVAAAYGWWRYPHGACGFVPEAKSAICG